MKKHQTFNDGVAWFYTLVNTAPEGLKKVEKPGRRFLQLRYEARTIGLRRLEAMAGLGQKADKMIRVPSGAVTGKIHTQCVCALENGEWYRINKTQEVTDAAPRSLDVYLERFELP